MNEIITNDFILEMYNSKMMELMNNTALGSLNSEYKSLGSNIIFYLIITLFIFIALCLTIKKKQSILQRIGKILIAFCLIIFLAYQAYSFSEKRNIIKYSIDNKCWKVEMDEIKSKMEKNNSLYLQLGKYNDVKVESWVYDEVVPDEKVYLIIAQGKSDNQYYIVSIWPQISDI